MRAENITIVSKQYFVRTSTANRRQWNKLYGALDGLLRKGFIGSYEYVSRPGSVCLAISDLGFTVIGHYSNDLAELYKRFKPHRNRLPGVDSFEQEKPRYKQTA